MMQSFKLPATLSRLSCLGMACLLATVAQAGTLRLGNGSEPQTLDVHVATGVPEGQILRALFLGLVVLDPETLEPQPGAARSWQISQDGLTYHFQLREDLRWSNGDVLTAHHFADSIRRMLTRELGASYAYLHFFLRGAEAFYRGESSFDEVGVEVPCDFSLILTLNKPVPFFLSLLTNPGWFPVHRESMQKHGPWTSRNADWTRPGNLLSNGPYQLVRWRINDHILLEPNPHYPGADQLSLRRIFFLPIDNAFAEERAFRDGLVDVSSIVPAQRLPHYLERAREPVLQVQHDLAVYYLILNTAVPPLDDPRVRRALSLSLDRTRISRDIRQRGEASAYHFTPPGIGGYEPPADLRYDPEEARRLLAAAGFPAGRGFPVLEFFFNTSETHRPIAETIQDIWRVNLGIHIQLANQEWKTYLERRQQGQFEIMRAGWIGDYLDPDTFLGLFLSNSTNNVTAWGDPEYDDLMQRANALPAGQERYALMRQAERILLRESPVIPVFFYNRAFLKHPRVLDWPDNVLGYRDYRRIKLRAPSESTTLYPAVAEAEVVQGQNP